MTSCAVARSAWRARVRCWPTSWKGRSRAPPPRPSRAGRPASRIEWAEPPPAQRICPTFRRGWALRPRAAAPPSPPPHYNSQQPLGRPWRRCEKHRNTEGEGLRKCCSSLLVHSPDGLSAHCTTKGPLLANQRESWVLPDCLDAKRIHLKLRSLCQEEAELPQGPRPSPRATLGSAGFCFHRFDPTQQVRWDNGLMNRCFNWQI